MVAILTIIIIVFLVMQKSNKTKYFGKIVDYSFGLSAAKAVRKHLLDQDFEMAEVILEKMSANDLTQTLDYIGLVIEKPLLMRWLKNNHNKDFPYLALGVYFIHEAWKIRSHAVAKEVADEQREGFLEFQKKALKAFLSMDKNSLLMPEVNARLIRVYMGLGEQTALRECFFSAIESNPDLVWAYLHYCEAIEPKWGGNEILIQEMMDLLPDNLLIKQIIELKIINDSIVFNANFFGGSFELLIQRAHHALVRIDKEISKKEPRSIHRYVLYGYMMTIAEALKNKEAQKKYMNKVGNYLALYPFGIRVAI